MAYSVDEVSPEEAKAKRGEAFRAISEVERMDSNVSGLVAELNKAIVLIEEGEVSENKALIRRGGDGVLSDLGYPSNTPVHIFEVCLGLDICSMTFGLRTH